MLHKFSNVIVFQKFRDNNFTVTEGTCIMAPVCVYILASYDYVKGTATFLGPVYYVPVY